MARAGRKRDTRPRHKCGKLIQPTLVERRVGPTPELERKKQAWLGDLATSAELGDVLAHYVKLDNLKADLWAAGARYRGYYIRAFGRVDAKPGALAGLIPDPDRGYHTDPDAEWVYNEIKRYVLRNSDCATERALYNAAVLRQDHTSLGLVVKGLKLVLEVEPEVEKRLASRREAAEISEMQAQQVGLAG